MKQQRLYPWLNLGATIITLVINLLSNALPFNHQTAAEITARYETYFVPAGYVFSIWGLIYLGLIAFSLYQVLRPQQSAPAVRRIGPLYVISCVANCVWLFLWHYNQFGLSVIAMGILLGSLIAIYLRLGINARPASTPEKLYIHLPFSLYLGWITVANIANITIALYAAQWSGWGLPMEGWTVLMFIVAIVIAAVISITRHDVPYLLVLVWAFIGIAVRQARIPFVAVSAWAAAIITLLLVVLAIVLQRAYKVRRYISDR